jgi:hypothetical protein
MEIAPIYGVLRGSLKRKRPRKLSEDRVLKPMSNVGSIDFEAREAA